ncbi:MAG: M20/M25/M40 family metallo-hydrolase, partial [Ignavibacteria bacterium]|nr:M20/M25/M40 family metallo-hydrolase [Ignavibacteria bacterium]
MTQARAGGGGDSKRVYREFVRRIADELESGGEKKAAARLRKALTSGGNPDFPRTELAWITHAYAREMYKDDIIRETGQLIKFRTFATDVPNRQNPEFIKQKEYLRSLAQKLGLQFNDVNGYVQEIWIGDGPESFGLMSHSDVQPVIASEWKSDPWSGAVVDGAIWGRGSVDDKGPIVAIMYGMRALLDSGFPLRKKIILLVGTDEESANEDVSTYLKTNAAPDQTIVVDSNYPVICAEKGWCG